MLLLRLFVSQELVSSSCERVGKVCWSSPQLCFKANRKLIEKHSLKRIELDKAYILEL